MYALAAGAAGVGVLAVAQAAEAKERTSLEVLAEVVKALNFHKPTDVNATTRFILTTG